MLEFLRKNGDYFKKFVFGVALIVVFKTFDSLPSIFDGFGIVKDAVMPFIAAFIIAYMLNLPCIKLESLISKVDVKFVKKHTRGISVLLVYILALLLVGITVGALVPALYENLVEMTKSLPYYMNSLIEKVQGMEALKNLNIDLSSMSIEATMDSVLKAFDAGAIGNYVGQVFSVTSSLFSVFIAIIASIYMLLDKDNIVAALTKFIKLIFKEEKAEHIMSLAANVNRIFTTFIYCRLMCGIICGTICVIVLSLMRVKYAVILGIFIGAMDLIPYFGSIIASVAAAGIALLTGGFWQGLWVAVALIIIQQFDGNILAPKLMGDSLELRPLWIVIIVAVGGNLFGFMGMLLAVPVLAVARAIIGDYIEQLQLKKSNKAREDKK